MSAHGSNAKPDGYREFMGELKAIIDPYLEQMRQAAIQQKIEHRRCFGGAGFWRRS